MINSTSNEGKHVQHLFLEKGELFFQPVVMDHVFISIPIISFLKKNKGEKIMKRKNSHIKALSIDIL